MGFQEIALEDKVAIVSQVIGGQKVRPLARPDFELLRVVSGPLIP